MHLPGNRFRSLTGLLVSLITGLFPVLILSRLLRSEGPHLILFCLSGCAAISVFSAVRASGKWRILFRFLAGTIAVLSVLTVLLQLLVTHRFLAEAWLDLARQGRPFGFFSFFVVELYALFCLGAVFLFSLKRYTGFFLFLFFTNLLTAGIILDNRWALALAIFLALAGVFFPSIPRSRNEVAYRLTSVFIPVIAGIILSVFMAFNPDKNESSPDMFRIADLSALALKLAPDFPLLRKIPGYGFSVRSGEMPLSVFLSGRPLFLVHGEPDTTLYLASVRYNAWNGYSWAEESDPGKEIILSRGIFSGKQETNRVRLFLADDFYPEFPVPQNTIAAIIDPDAPERVRATQNRGIRFTPGAHRGIAAELEIGPETEAMISREIPATYLDPGPDPDGRLAQLSTLIRKSTGSSDRDYLSALLSYFSDGFIYSLEVAPGTKTRSAIDRFIFTEKKGFCLYFATAFVILAREQGIPARLAEGFRVHLDNSGKGTITGNNAHAWPEVLLDGKWVRYEPTPAFSAVNPYAYLGPGDRKTGEQLEALFGEKPQENLRTASEQKTNRLQFFFLSGIVLAAGLTSALWAIHHIVKETKKGKLRRKAARLVRKYRRQGIPGPEFSGWLLWAEKVENIRKDGLGTEIAKAMLRESFSASLSVQPDIPKRRTVFPHRLRP